jgi:hypothetical protein
VRRMDSSSQAMGIIIDEPKYPVIDAAPSMSKTGARPTHNQRGMTTSCWCDGTADTMMELQTPNRRTTRACGLRGWAGEELAAEQPPNPIGVLIRVCCMSLLSVL